LGAALSGGQPMSVPSHVSASSQLLVAARQTTPAPIGWQLPSFAAPAA
jgi:hypothetical protein